MTIEGEPRRGEPLSEDAWLVLDEVIRHSRGRTGETARAIEAGRVALRDDAVLARGHRKLLEEFASMISLCAGVGTRWIVWRDAVDSLLGAIRPDPNEALSDAIARSMSPRQAQQLVSSLSDEQREVIQQAFEIALARR